MPNDDDSIVARALDLAEESFIAASGPGGQNVNKVATACSIVRHAPALFPFGPSP